MILRNPFSTHSIPEVCPLVRCGQLRPHWHRCLCLAPARLRLSGSFTRAPVPSHVLLDTKLDGLSLVRRGKVRDVYAADDDADPRRDRSHLGVRLCAGLGHPRQGPRAQSAVRVLVRPHRRIIQNHLISTNVADYPGSARAYAAELDGARCWRDAPPAAGRMRRARLHFGIGMEGLQGHRRSVRHRRCRRVCANRIACREPIFTPATKAESGHDENISEAAAAEVVGADCSRA